MKIWLKPSKSHQKRDQKASERINSIRLVKSIIELKCGDSSTFIRVCVPYVLLVHVYFYVKVCGESIKSIKTQR